ncbi:hypothetical protein HNQ51_003100 [Inhella inkyongensis]|uniref:Uncharacterized protein n=1 Tax=Inhella inkyongensis TaxID=392593 RepID=A0A840S7X7_9BURK|nr:hypothetical protein [Inhella inkyongensis]MBB5205773.1 hypothetical protein [Inhella inkyongensis]
MSRLFRGAACLFAFGSFLGAVHAGDVDEQRIGRELAAALSQEIRSLCVFDNGAPAGTRFAVVRKLKVAKGTYGGVKELLPEFGKLALQARADAVVDYNSSQRFGFWPWRVVRPVVTGTAIRWSEAPTQTCEALGGVRLETILLTNRSPESMARQEGAPARPPAVEIPQPSASEVEVPR